MALNQSQLFSQLGDALLQEVLQRVPQRERLAQCALVCSAWREAAILGTKEVVCFLLPSRVAALKQWLEQHAGRLQGLELTGTTSGAQGDVVLHVPWLQLSVLERLCLSKCWLPRIPQLPSGTASSLGAASGMLPHLRQLKVDHCSFDSSEDFFLLLAGHTALTSLYARLMIFRDAPLANQAYDEHREGVRARMCKELQLLQSLTVLQLPSTPRFGYSARVFQPIAAMTRLQHLDLLLSDSQDGGSSIADLPSCLTKLKLGQEGDGQPLPSPEWQKVTNLLDLQLGKTFATRCSLLPEGLGSCTQLLRLRLEGCVLLPDAANGAAACLRAMQQLTHMESLHIEGMPLIINSDRDPLQLYSGLTASTRLTKLCVQAIVPPLGEGAVGQMFVAGRHMPELIDLRIQNEHGDNGWCVDSEGLSRLCSSCPRLEKLKILGVVEPGTDIDPLAQLLTRSCNCLTVGGSAFGDKEAAVVAQMMQLNELSWQNSPHFSDVGLERLTALCDLDSLSVIDCDLSPQVAGLWHDDLEPPALRLEQGLFSVCEQLKSVCDQSLICWRARLQRQEAETARLREHVQTLQQQLAERDAQLAAIAASQAQVQQLQQRLSQFEGSVNDQPEQ